jgi:hypothetical protein
VLQIPFTCRMSRCRRSGSCQGGFGPPCYLESRQAFVKGVGEQMQEYREYWPDRYRTIQAEERRR